MKFFKLNKQKGLTLIEFILVLAIFSLLAMGVYNLSSNVTASTKAVAEAEKLNTNIEKIERVVGVSGDYSNITREVFDEITENYASNFDLVSVNPQYARLEIVYENVPGKSCTKFSESMLVKNDNVSLRINNVNLPPYSSVALVSAACQEDNQIIVVLDNNGLARLANISNVVPEPISIPNSTPDWPIKNFPYAARQNPLSIDLTNTSITSTNTGVGFN